MGKLANHTVYIIGFMQSDPNNGEAWRNDLIPFLHSLNIQIFNPCNKPVNVGLEDRQARKLVEELKKEEKYDELASVMKEVRAVDLRMVDKADFIIFNLDNNFPTCGSHEEWVTANRQKKPIIVRCEQGKQNIPNWMFGALPHELFFSTWQEVKDYLTRLDQNDSTLAVVDRWVFFDHSKMTYPITN